MQSIIDTFRKDLYAGQTVLVSGATSGIGLAIAEGFARMGASVVATGTSRAKLDKVRKEPALSGIRFEYLDVRDRAAIDQFVPALGSLSVLVNAAGIVKPDDEFNEDAYMEVIDVNMNSQMRLAMAAHPLLKASKGAIINTASRSGWHSGQCHRAGLSQDVHDRGHLVRARTRRQDRAPHGAQALGHDGGPRRNVPVPGLSRSGLCDRHHAARRWRLCERRLVGRRSPGAPRRARASTNVMFEHQCAF